MILNDPRQLAIFASLALMAVPARADVMEIGSDGAHWVNGPMAGANAHVGSGVEQVAQSQGELVEVEQSPVPEGAVANPELHAQTVPPAYSAKVRELATRFDLSPALIEALVWQESRWRPNAISHAGARGLAQLMPGTARDLGVNPDDPFQNLEGGARYLREQLDRFDGDLERALAAYNAGPHRVQRAGGIPNIRETRLYVAAIMGRLASHSRSPN